MYFISQLNVGCNTGNGSFFVQPNKKMFLLLKINSTNFVNNLILQEAKRSPFFLPLKPYKNF